MLRINWGRRERIGRQRLRNKSRTIASGFSHQSRDFGILCVANIQVPPAAQAARAFSHQCELLLLAIINISTDPGARRAEEKRPQGMILQSREEASSHIRR